MARTIESPGVEIREIDLSNVTQLPIGTNIYVQGFAAQGPTQELLNVTTVKEFERIYGTPTNVAESYFYESAKKVLQSSGRLVANRLPYGDGSGFGSARSRSALFYPYVPVFDVGDTVVPATTASASETAVFTDAGITTLTLNNEVYNNVIALTMNESLSGGTPSATVSTTYLGNLANLIVYNDGSTLDGTTEYTAAVVNNIIEITFSSGAIELSGVRAQYPVDASDYTVNQDTINLTPATPSINEYTLTVDYDYVTNVPETSTSKIDYNETSYSLAPGSSAADLVKGFVLGAPVLIPNLSAEQLEAIKDGSFFGNAFEYSNETAKALAGLALNDGGSLDVQSFNLGKAAGLIVVNNNYTNVERDFSGTYVSIIDSNKLDDDDYDKVQTVYTRNGSGGFVPLTSVGSNVQFKDKLTGSLTGTQGSISEFVEKGAAWSETFGSDDGKNYKHALAIATMKVYKDEAESQGNNIALRSYPVASTFLGSFDPAAIGGENNPYGGSGNQSIFIEDTDSYASPWVEVFVSPTIKNLMNSEKFVRLYNGAEVFAEDDVIADSMSADAIAEVNTELADVFGTKYNNGLYALGPYAPVDSTDTKAIGDVAAKLDKGLALAENSELIPLDIVIDSGLSTIFTVMKKVIEPLGQTRYSDSVNFPNLKDFNGRDEWLTIYNKLNDFCQSVRKDCMCIIDPLRHIFVQNKDTKVLSGATKTFSQDVLVPLREFVNPCNSSYAAIYANWVKIYSSGLGQFVWSPFSGVQAALMADLDARLQPWFAPAGFNNGIINGVVDICISPNQRERDLLYRYNINPVASFPGDGFVVFGQKTLQAKPSAFDRINVRRLFLFLEKAAKAAAKYYVFEPNTIFTRTRLVNSLTPIFERAKSTQGLYDYLIVCDERNNAPDVIDRNELVVDIYIKPVRTAEFILINFIATRTGANFEEIISGTGA